MKLGINVLLDDTYAVSEPKFEIRKVWALFRREKPLINGVNGGGVVPHIRTFWGFWKSDFDFFIA